MGICPRTLTPRWPTETARAISPAIVLRLAEIGKDGDRQVTVAEARPFAEGIVVGSHHVQLEGGIAELEVIPAGRIGKEHFRIDAVAIQSLQPFPRIIGGPWHFLPSLGIGRKRIAH